MLHENIIYKEGVGKGFLYVNMSMEIVTINVFFLILLKLYFTAICN